MYQAQISGTPGDELLAQFRDRREYERVDPDYFAELLGELVSAADDLDADIAELADRPFEQLDPVEIAVLRVGLIELRSHPEVPYRVVINEGVDLARRFGAEDGHKYVNAILDRAARKHRAAERDARRGGRDTA
jgi:N utilization substance protein B